MMAALQDDRVSSLALARYIANRPVAPGDPARPIAAGTAGRKPAMLAALCATEPG